MSFPRYPSYKPSGVEWLGDLPSHWGVYPLKRELDYITSGSRGWAENYSDNGSLFIRIANLTRDRIELDLTDVQRVNVAEGSEGARTRVRAGDILFSITAYLGSIAVVPDDIDEAYVSQHVALARLRSPSSLPRWIGYVALSGVGRTWFDMQSYGGTKIQLSLDDVRELPVLAPPVSEQAAIVTFLDRETAKIDALVAEQERLIELLKEKRQAVISHAVTKGLNPDAPMKPSGVEWLGDVPAHWSILAIKRLSPVKRGASPRPIEDPRYFDDDGEFAWVRILDVSASDGVLRSTEQRLSTLGSSLSVKVGAGDLFVSIAGTVGKPCISAIKACIHDGFVYFPRLTLNPRFMYRIFESGLCYGGLGKWGTQLNLNTDTVGAIRVAVPPPDELVLVVEYIDRETAALDLLSREAQSVIALLQARRSALVSAAVTGQIDVLHSF